MLLTNLQIYNYMTSMSTHFVNINTYIPAKANFFIQKNISLLREAMKDIEKTRIHIIQEYGLPSDAEGTEYTFTDENLPKVETELNELFSIEQELAIQKFSIDALGNAEFTPAQMQAIMFMIEE